jgi:hypothetical protein
MHSNQRLEASKKSARCTAPSVEVRLFDDKIKDCGSLSVSKGSIKINFDYPLYQTTPEVTGVLIADAISQAVISAFELSPEAFDPFVK